MRTRPDGARPRAADRRARTRVRYRAARCLAAAVLVLGLAGCDGGGEDEGGIIGTGIQLRGTVPTERTLARDEVGIRAASGELSVARIGANGRFAADAVDGAGPWLLRVDLGNGDAWHAIAHRGGSAARNVHAYSDLALRNWFATRGLSIDDAYDASGTTPLPDPGDIDAIERRVNALIAGSLDAWDLAGVDLATVSFDADDAGVDGFLDANPVRVADGRVTVLVTDPDDATQARAVDGLPLSTDLAAADVAPPTPPTALRVLPSARDEIVLAWRGADDDVGIAGYEIVRDGLSIAQTPYPVFLDSPLRPDVPYTYEIVTIDASGNRSAPSAPGSSTTLDAPDVDAPPAPVNLRLAPTLDSVSLEWGQADIGDVASFTIERGPDPSRLIVRARVTATFAIDAGLDGGTRYCYRVRASDASGNDSPPTPTVCTETLGEGVTTATGAPLPAPGRASPLAGVDVGALDCPDPVPTLRVASAVTFDAPCLRVPSTLSVVDGGTLTIAPGTVLKFADTGGLLVDEGGALVAEGTAAAPIVLSGERPTPGAWNGLTFRFSDEPDNRLGHVVVEHAGASGAAALITDARDALPVRLDADELLIRDNAGAGFAFAANTTLGGFSRVRVTGNASAGTLSPRLAAALGSDSGFAGNAQDGVRLLAGELTEPAAWNRIDAPWLIERLTLDASLSLPPGTELRFDVDGVLRVAQTGSLAAVGTAAEPILLTGGDGAGPGHWEGLSYEFSGSGNNRLAHVAIEHAGARGTVDGAAILTDASALLPARLTLSDVTLRRSAGAGFRFAEHTRLNAFENVVSTANASSGALFPATLAGFGAGNDFTGNARDGLDLSRQTLDEPLRIPAVGVPYRFERLVANAPLSVAPGVTLRARAGAEIRVGQRGSLNAVGTADAPIVVEGAVAVPGHWDGIAMIHSASDANRLGFVTLAHGGGTGAPFGGNLRLRCRAGLPTRIAIRETRIADGAAWGVHRDDPDNCELDVGAGVAFDGNALGGLAP